MTLSDLPVSPQPPPIPLIAQQHDSPPQSFATPATRPVMDDLYPCQHQNSAYSTGPPGCATNPIVVSPYDEANIATTTWPGRPPPGSIMIVSHALRRDRCMMTGIEFLLVKGTQYPQRSGGGRSVWIFASREGVGLLCDAVDGVPFEDWLPAHWMPACVVEAWQESVRTGTVPVRGPVEVKVQIQKQGFVCGEAAERELSEEEQEQVWHEACHGNEPGSWERRLMVAMKRLMI